MSAEALMPLPINSAPAAEYYSTSLANMAGRLSNTQVASITAQSVPNWIGEAADAYTDEIRQLRSRVEKLRDTTTPVRNVLDDWAEAVNHAVTVTVPNLHSEYDEATAQFERQKSDLEQMREELASGIYHFELTAIRENYNDRVSEIVNRYKLAMNELDAKAQETAGKIRAAIDAYIPPEVVKKGRDAIGATLFDGMPLVDGQAQWEFAQSQAREAAELLGDGIVSEEEFREFHEKYGELCDDPFFANALAEQVPPETLLRFVMHLEALRNSHTSDGMLDEARNAAINENIKNFGSLLVLSTGGMNLEDSGQHQASFELVKRVLRGDDGSSLEALTRKHSAEWKTVGRTFYGPDGLPVSAPNFQENGFGHYGYEYIGAMLNHAALNENLALGPAFMEEKTSLAHDLMSWDHETFGKIGDSLGYGNWHPNIFGGNSDMLDPMQGMLKLMDHPVAVSDGSLGSLNTSDSSPLAKQINARFDAVQKFMAGNTAFSVDQNEAVDRVPPLFKEGEEGPNKPMNVTRYLTSFRTIDSVRSMTDGGEALGRVLAQSASVGEMPPGLKEGTEEYAQWNARQRRSTEIAAYFLQGYQDGLEIDWDSYRGENAFGMANRGLRSWAGEILAPHIDKLSTALANPGAAGGITILPGKETTFSIGQDMSSRMLGKDGLFSDLAFDKAYVDTHGTPDDPKDDTYYRGRMPAIDRLVLAAQQGYHDDLVASRTTHEQFDSIAGKWATTFDALLTASPLAEEATQEAVAEANKRLHFLIDTGLSLFPVTKALQAGPVTTLIDTALTGLQGQALESILPTEHDSSDEIVRGSLNAEKMLKLGHTLVLLEDPEFLQKNPEVLASLTGVNTATEERIPPFWDADGRIPSVVKLTSEQLHHVDNALSTTEPYKSYRHIIEQEMNDAAQNRDENQTITK